jgi:hypothetical protein
MIKVYEMIHGHIMGYLSIVNIPYAARTGRSSSNNWNSRFNRVSI